MASNKKKQTVSGFVVAWYICAIFGIFTYVIAAVIHGFGEVYNSSVSVLFLIVYLLLILWAMTCAYLIACKIGKKFVATSHMIVGVLFAVLSAFEIVMMLTVKTDDLSYFIQRIVTIYRLCAMTYYLYMGNYLATSKSAEKYFKSKKSPKGIL